MRNNWRQEDLAEKLNTKKNTISRYENGERGIDLETLHKLCDIFGVTADYLLCRSSTPEATISDAEADLLAAYRAADSDTKAMVQLALKRWLPSEVKSEVS